MGDPGTATTRPPSPGTLEPPERDTRTRHDRPPRGLPRLPSRAVRPGRRVVTVATDVSVRLDGGVAVLCLDGAERMNAIGSHTYRALATAVTGVENNGRT